MIKTRCSNCSGVGHRGSTCKLPISKTKICSKCGAEKSRLDFGNDKGTRDKLNVWCKDCVILCNHKYRASIGYKIKKDKKELQLKSNAVARYGGKCQCCGEWRLSFLNIDHEFNDGAVYRKQNLSGRHLYVWLEKNNYPLNLGFRVLCWNCNCGRMVNKGICPHLE